MKKLFFALIVIIITGCESKKNRSIDFYVNGVAKTDSSDLSCFDNNWCHIIEKNGRLISKYQLFNYKNSKLLNQSIIYNMDGTVDMENSSFFEIMCDTLRLGRNRIGIKYCPKFKDDENNIVFCTGRKINSKFDNLNVTKIDTFMSRDKNYFIGVEFKRLGIDTIRGFIEEQIFTINSDSTQLSAVRHKKFFEKVVYVKDTVE